MKYILRYSLYCAVNTQRLGLKLPLFRHRTFFRYVQTHKLTLWAGSRDFLVLNLVKCTYKETWVLRRQEYLFAEM